MSTGGETLQRPKKLITQQSTVWTRRQNAVCVRRARKTYGSKTNQHVILDNLNMTVPKGCIYGLLGASGCGKTTLLSCIVGRRRLNSGEIWVLGGRPGTKGSGVPGPRIGYMPQEMALYGEFTIRETFCYFGWIAGMTTERIEERTAFLLNLLQLPGPERQVKSLSGGQQRRVSMAATFLNEPELLILDEPTVGVDPLIRQSVWDYLVEITSDKTTTVIITTHYIDETKQATTVGMMRGGRFLAEESPAEVLQRFNTESLEDAFLKLSILQNKGKRRRSSICSNIITAQASTLPGLDTGMINDGFDNKSEISGEFGDNMSIASVPAAITTEVDPLPPDEEVDFSWTDCLHIYKSNHMKALVWKNFLWIFRNITFLMYVIGIPIMEICIFCWGIGKDPTGLNIGIVNNEVPFEGLCSFNDSCVYERLSCRYLHHISKRNQILVPYSSKDEAAYAVQKGWAWAYVDFPSEFSKMLTMRLELGKEANDSIINNSEISIHLDKSNNQISLLLQRDFLRSLEDFAKDMSTACELPEGVISTPLRFNDPIYGYRVPNFTDFAAPGVILTIVFFISVSLTSVAMVVERKEGILERCLVSGITGLEIMSAHIVTQFVVMVWQSVLIIVFGFFIFGLTNEGSLLWIVILITLCGTCGMTYGFMVSCVCNDERSATYLALGSFLPFVTLCGIIWPTEGMNAGLRYISSFLPLFYSTESLRSMLSRGWGIEEPMVYIGFITISVWIVILITLSVLLIKFKMS